MPKRRGNNEGSYYKLSNGKYRAAVSLGNRKRLTHTCDDVKRAKAWISQTLTQLRMGGPVTSGAEELGHYMLRWFEDHKMPTLSDKSIRTYQFVVNRVLADDIGAVSLEALRRTHFDALYRRLPLAPKSIRLVHTVLHQALDDAVADEFILRNPANDATLPRLERKERPVLGYDEIVQFLEEHEHDRLAPLWAVLATCGLRIGEAVALRWKDISDGYLTVVDGKTPNARRQIPLLDSTEEMLMAHRNRQREERLAAGPGWEGPAPSEGLVFRRLNGRAITQSEAYGQLQKALEESNLPQMRVHDLRHSAATFMMQAGVPIEVVSRIIGHASISTTTDIYGHIRPAMLEDARERMKRYVKGS